MRVLVVGSGAREHALCWKISQSPRLTQLIAAPGNPGIAAVARCADVSADDLDGLTALARREKIDLVVVGPEDPLALGLADRLLDAGIAVFGPSAAAARLESSKSFAKDLMHRAGIPTARYEVVRRLDEALAALDRWEFPLAVKADGLARGRGVTIAATRAEAEEALRRCMADRAFGAGGETVVLEEFLEGEEVSLIGISDGTRMLALQPAQDHKQLLDGDRGPNTGGMGCFSPVPFFGSDQASTAAETVLQRAVDAMRQEGCPFRGALFAGLMLTPRGLRVLEYNVRFGDPETEVLLCRLKSDLLPLLYVCATGTLPNKPLEWMDEAAVCVVLASGGYPGSFAKGLPIDGLGSDGQLKNSMEGVQVFHAGSSRSAGGPYLTAGGRVLAVTALGADHETAIHRAYTAASHIQFENLHLRRDIGHRHRPGAA